MELFKIFRHYWKSIIVIGCILYLSFAPPSTFQGIPTFNFEDKLVHLLMYASLTIVLIFDHYRTVKELNVNKIAFILICLVFPTLFGGVIEIIQPLLFFPRSASWLDWLADILGVLIGWQTMKLIYKNLKI